MTTSRTCETQHTDRCPRSAKPLTPQEKANREKKVKTVIVSDSQLRMVDEIELPADVVTILGGKLGHTANSLTKNSPSTTTSLSLEAQITRNMMEKLSTLQRTKYAEDGIK